MNGNLLDSPANGWPSSQVLYWVSMFLCMLVLSGIAITIEADRLSVSAPLEQFLSFRLTSSANVLLAIAAVLYLLHLRATSKLVGRWATGLATLGAVVVVAGLFTRVYEMHQSWMSEGRGIAFSVHEGAVLLTAITVVAYLMMERSYRNRSAGALVMPIVLFAVAFEIWLVANGQAAGVLHGSTLSVYWLSAQLLAYLFGFGAFTLAAAVGFLFLMRCCAEKDGAQNVAFIRMLPGSDQVETWVKSLVCLGLPLFAVGALLDRDLLSHQWSTGLPWYPRAIWAFLACLVYATFFFIRKVKYWPPHYMAWWSVSAYGISLLCFILVHLVNPFH